MSAGYESSGYMSGLTMGFILVVLDGARTGSRCSSALVAGDIVSKEVEDGSMRMTLCRPISSASHPLAQSHRLYFLYLRPDGFFVMV